MPEIEFTVRWPDGRTQRCVSPSRSIELAIVTGARYPVGEFVRRARAAFDARRPATARDPRLRLLGGRAAHRRVRRHRGRAFGADELVTIEHMRGVRPRRRFPGPSIVEGHRTVVIVGGGQAGLAASFELTRRGIDHVILERDRLAASWRDQRWDEFCLVTPNWQCQLPGHPYDGDDPDGFMLKQAIIDYIERYADAFGPPLWEGVEVTEVARADDRFTVTTPRGALTCDHVVLAVGGYHIPRIPAMGACAVAGDHPIALVGVPQRHLAARRRGARRRQRPVGRADRRGPAPLRAARCTSRSAARRGSRAATAGATASRGCTTSATTGCRSPSTRRASRARREPNHYVTGRGGGRDIDLRAFARDGMRLHGRLLGGDGDAACVRRRPRAQPRRCRRDRRAHQGHDRPLDPRPGHRRPRGAPLRAASGSRRTTAASRWTSTPKACER